MSKIAAAFLIPLLSCWIYTMYGGLKATFFASYVHTTVIFFMLLVFTFTVYGSGGDGSGLYGSADAVYDGLEKASLHGFFSATGIFLLPKGGFIVSLPSKLIDQFLQ